MLWHAKHEITHVVLGLLWAWYVGTNWGQWQNMWIIIAAIGGLLPDAEHIYYFLTYGNNDPYSQTVLSYFKKRRWRELVSVIERGHKKNTHLIFHNYYTILFFMLCLWIVLAKHWQSLVVLFGALLSHFLYDLVEDILVLGKVNANWGRWGREKIV